MNFVSMFILLGVDGMQEMEEIFLFFKKRFQMKNSIL